MERRPPFHEIVKRECKLRGWSQAELANQLQIDPKTVQRWQSGRFLPRPEIRPRLSELLGKTIEELGLLEQEQESAPHLQEDWGEAPAIGLFSGRQEESKQVKQWTTDERCRLVAILGMGGMGKTTFATHLAQTIKNDFDFVFWRSLSNAPTLEHLLKQCIPFLSGSQGLAIPQNTNDQISLLLQLLRRKRCLLIFDNAESLLQAGEQAGHYLSERESYGTLFQRIGQTQHQSCLLLTSREKTGEIALLEGTGMPVRSLMLTGLSSNEGQEVLREKGLRGTDEDWETLTHLYSGNPLALQLVSEVITNAFGGEISYFLEEGQSVFGGINDLLEQQFQRLHKREQELLYWLAIEREAVTLNILRNNLTRNSSRTHLPETISLLQRRFLLETRGQVQFILQPVILEYVTNRLIQQFVTALQTLDLTVWASYTLLKAQTRDYVRDSQRHFLLHPLAEQLEDIYEKQALAQQLEQLLAAQRQKQGQPRSYLAGNVLNLLLHLDYDLRGMDFSSLPIWQAHLQNAHLPEVNFAFSSFRDTSFTDTFGNIYAVAFSRTGNFFALGTAMGDIWVYRASDYTPMLTCRGHTDGVWSLTISRDGHWLVSSSDDHTIRIWDLRDEGNCVRIISEHSSRVRTTTLSYDNQLLASGSDDRTIRLWDFASGEMLHKFEGHTDYIWTIALSPDSQLLASGSNDSTVRLWETRTGTCQHILKGHTYTIRAVAFSPDGKLLASGGDDHTIRLWQAQSGQHLTTLPNHSNRVWAATFSPDGRLLASGSEDHTIRLWETSHWRCLSILQGHTRGVRSVTFSPDGQTVLSGADDQSARLWDASTGYGFKTLQGYTSRLRSIALSPDGQHLVSASEDQELQVWDTATSTSIQTFRDRTHGVRAIALSPNGRTLASGGEDQTVRLWNIQNGQQITTLRGHTNWVWTVAFSPDGRLLASGGEDQTVRIWQPESGRTLQILEGQKCWIRSIAFSPDGTLLASGGDNQEVWLWQTADGRILRKLSGHSKRVRSVTFSPDGTLLASSSEDHTIRLWRRDDGTCLRTLPLTEENAWVRSVAFSPDSRLLASGSEDCSIRLWETQTGTCLHTLPGHQQRVRSLAYNTRPEHPLLASGDDDGQIMLWDGETGALLKGFRGKLPYEQMDITGISGLRDAQKAALKLLGATENGI